MNLLSCPRRGVYGAWLYKHSRTLRFGEFTLEIRFYAFTLCGTNLIHAMLNYLEYNIYNRDYDFAE